MGLNIKNERTHALVRELADLTGRTQSSAVEAAVERMLADERARVPSGTETRDARIDGLLDRLWASGSIDLVGAEDEIYDAEGLPR